ncbi:MAG TPA: Hsp20/alpha crystallin family protein [Saprospiraceae bacterium]|nr:Hsp20/alpha crystallin family protein [Saprospiraceae bacterium]
MYHNHLNVAPTMIKVIKPMIDELLNEIEKPNTTHKSVAANILETENAFEIELAVIGHSKESINISIEENILKVEGNINAKDQKYKLKEFGVQSFKRSFNLPKNIDKDMIKARFENGILIINLPKSVPFTTKVDIV